MPQEEVLLQDSESEHEPNVVDEDHHSDEGSGGATPCRDHVPMQRCVLDVPAPSRDARGGSVGVAEMQLPGQVPEGTEWMDPSDLRYSQDTISPAFSDERRFDHTIYELKMDNQRVHNMPVIRVCQLEAGGPWHSVDNRRLYCFKKAGLKSVPVQRVAYADHKNKFTFTKKTKGLEVSIDYTPGKRKKDQRYKETRQAKITEKKEAKMKEKREEEINTLREQTPSRNKEKEDRSTRRRAQQEDD